MTAPSRRWFRFSMRSLFLVVMLFVGWLGSTEQHRLRLQFTIRAVLGATFWMAVSFLAFALFENNSQLNVSLALPLFYVFIVSPFIAVGTLFGRPWAGLLIGLTFGAIFVRLPEHARD